jgi:hypothetical protein
MNSHGPTSVYSLDHVADDELHASTRRLVAGSAQLLAALLAHLGEVEARGIHRERACASLYTYCIYELRMSEDAAFRRARAAKIARQFPVLFERIAAGEIHLTGVLLLGPLLTEANHLELLARAKHRTKKEIVRLVRTLSPVPDVPPVVEPLGPQQDGAGAGRATWSRWMQALCSIRELPPGDRPKDWMAAKAVESHADVPTATVDSNADDARLGSLMNATSTDEPVHESKEKSTVGRARESTEESDCAHIGGAESFARQLLRATPEPARQRYKVQFTATQEYVDLLDEAKDLLAHAVPSRSLEEVHLRAMRALVTELRKRKNAVSDDPRPRAIEDDRARGAGPRAEHSDPRAGESAVDETAAESWDVAASGVHPTPADDADDGTAAPRQRGRYVPAAIRRAVWARDGARCTYVDARGHRCRETGRLELHHEAPYARGGPPTESNLCLRCRAHNDLAAERDFGRDFMARKKGMTLPHELFDKVSAPVEPLASRGPVTLRYRAGNPRGNPRRRG